LVTTTSKHILKNNVSDGHTKNEITYDWYEGDGGYPVSVSKSLTMRPFDLEGYGASDCSEKVNKIGSKN
jgi:hypothetical protein